MNPTDLQPVSIVDVILNSVDKGRYVQTLVVISRPIRWIYLPVTVDGSVVDSKGFVTDSLPDARVVFRLTTEKE